MSDPQLDREAHRRLTVFDMLSKSVTCMGQIPQSADRPGRDEAWSQHLPLGNLA